jgi:hypothetical protein
MKGRLILTALMLPFATSWATDDVRPLLASLGKELAALRALPVGSETNSRCPPDTRTLIGLRKSALKQSLGRPDYIEPSQWTFFFTSPVPPNQFGGGFPELSFWFDANDLVTEIKCHYSR